MDYSSPVIMDLLAIPFKYNLESGRKVRREDEFGAGEGFTVFFNPDREKA
jgi:hypothetical protein